MGHPSNLTLDVTVNTDFAQVEVDEEQVNLTRFDLFFPEKRPFFLENASTFQFGQPQQVDIFFSRRIGLSPTGLPIDIFGGARLSGKLGNWNVGLLNVQTNDPEGVGGVQIAPENNFTVLRASRDVGRSSFGGIFVNRQTTAKGSGLDDWNRSYGVDGNWQASSNQRVRRSSPAPTRRRPPDQRRQRLRPAGSSTTSAARSGRCRAATAGRQRFNPEVGFLPRRGYRRPEARVFFQPQPKSIKWIRRFAPHVSYGSFYGFDGELQSSTSHIHPFEIQPMQGGRFGWFMDYNQDNPTGALRGLQPRRQPGGDSGRPGTTGCSTPSNTSTTRARRSRSPPATASATTTTATSRASS